jgi:hypothetical protein
MPQQQVIWTTLPNGRRRQGTGERLMVSVVVAPRLRLDGGATGVLQSFPDFLDWPAHLKQNLLGFDLIIDDDETRPVAAMIATAEPPDSELWRALFSATTPVRSQKFEGIREPIATFPVSTVAAELRDSYGKIGREAPFRPSDKATFKRNFADLAQALAPDGIERTRTMRANLREARTRGTAALGGVHRELAVSLLKSDNDFTFDDKLSEAIEVAGVLARSAPPGQVVPLVPETGQPGVAFAQFAAFHSRAGTRARPPSVTAGVARKNPIEEIDFHRILTALGDYPWLLRRLGLVINLEVDASLVPKSSIGALRHLRVRPRFSSPAGAATSYMPVTKYILDDTISNNPLPFPAFVAAPRRAAEPPSILPTLEIVGGLLNLRLLRPSSTQDLQFDIVTVDIDGAAKKIVNAVKSIVKEEEQQGKPIDATVEMAPPAIQTSGLNLVRLGQANQLMAGVATAQAHENDRTAGRRAVLFAEDLVRGYRIDIRRFPPGQPAGQPWLSLHRRIGSFRFKRDGQSDITLNNIADEGFLQPVLMQEPKASPQDPSPIYIHESYGRWQGWSLSAPFPAEPMDLTPAEPTPVVAPPGLLRLEVTMAAAPRTLPLLRFGHHYQMRVRTVDLAGNGLTVEDATDKVMVPLAVNNRLELHLPLMEEEQRGEPVLVKLHGLPFRRYEPIASPVLVPREELLEGEAVDVIVIRSNGPPTTTASYAADLHDQRYRGFSERHVVPPKSSQRMAELHGRLDAAFGIVGDPSTVFAACRRGAGTLNDTFVTNIRTGNPEPLPDIVRTDPVAGTQTTITNGLRFVNTDQSPVPRAASGYTVHYEEQLRLPYLPDPLAQGAALFHLPGLDNESLVLVEGSGPGSASRLESIRPQLLPDQAIRELGLVTKISFPPNGEWPELHPFRLRLDGHDPPRTARAPVWSEVNGVRVLTVRLAPAEVQVVWVSTYPAKEDVGLFGLHFWWTRLGAPEGERHFLNMAQHGALGMLSPARKVLLVHAVQQPLMEPKADGVPFALRKFSGETAAYVVGDFKIHGASTEKLDLLASWTEPRQDIEDIRSMETHVLEVPIDLDHPPPSIQGDPVPIGSYTKGTERFEFHAPECQSEARARSFLARHEFGDTRHRRVTYRLVATTRFREYFPESITRVTEKIVRTTKFENIIVLNSARPPALEISSIIPSFQWVRNFQIPTSTRSGGRLRVYLGRSWFVTGEGEAVAVVGDVVAGADPLHAVSFSGSPDTIKPKGAKSVSIAGQPNLKVFAFPVHRDAELGLWYADLAFDTTGTYFPFIALRLARFQEQSVEGLQLSPVVEAGLHQLAPDRTAVLARLDADGNKRKIEITVSGTRASAAGLSGGDHLTYRVEVEIEERAPGGSDQRDEDLGWKRSTTIVPSIATGPLVGAELWKGHILVPVIADMERRIVIKEFELFAPNDPPPGQAWSGETPGGPSRRLVYADVIRVR